MDAWDLPRFGRSATMQRPLSGWYRRVRSDLSLQALIRNRPLIAILHRAGLRISEAFDLYPKPWAVVEAVTSRVWKCD